MQPREHRVDVVLDPLLSRTRSQLTAHTLHSRVVHLGTYAVTGAVGADQAVLARPAPPTFAAMT
jgi:hypothetical protein